MIDYKYFDIFQHKNGSADKDWEIEYDGGSFTDWDMFDQSIELTESLCSEKELRFGSCEASCLKFKVANIVKPLFGEWITVSVAIDHHDDEPLIIGRYKVASEELTADRQYKEIVAYDAMYDIINADVSAWYNSILPNKDSKVTLKDFRESFMRNFGLEWVVPDDGLANDSMVVERTIDPEQISGRDVITAICEINGCFGHIGRDGKFHYIYLRQSIQGLYPADDLFPDHAPDYLPQQQITGHLYPQDPKGFRIGPETYIDCHSENYVVKPIIKLQIRNKENDVGKIWPEDEITPDDSCYIIEDNFLVYGKSDEQLSAIAENIYGKITNIVYRPFDADVMGNPCFEVGDPVRIPTKFEIIESYILQRTLKGIQALRDYFIATGAEKRSENVNSAQKSIVQLKGKTNTIIRTVEENRIEMLDITGGLSNTITVTARDIRAELENSADSLTNTISVTAAQIRTELNNAKDGLESSITQTAAQIRTEVSSADQSLQSQITQNAGEIDLRVRKDNVISSINLSPESITLEAQRIDLKGLVNAQELVSKFATITTLNAVDAKIGRIESDYVSTAELNAESATLQSLIAGQIEAVNGKIQNFNADNITSGTISVQRLNLDQLFGQEISGRVINVNTLEAAIRVTASVSMNAPNINCSVFYCDSINYHNVSWETIIIGGKSYTVLTG